MRHPFALFGAVPTRFRASLTMLLGVARAFLGTRLANLRAQPAEPDGEPALARHVRGRHPADRRAIDIKGDARDHHLHIVFSKARRCAVVAGIRARVARVDAGSIPILSHASLLVETSADGLDCRCKDVPRAPLGVDELRCSVLGLYLLAQPPDLHIYGAIVHLVVVQPR